MATTPYATVAIIVSGIHLLESPDRSCCFLPLTEKYWYAIHITIEMYVEKVLLLKISNQSTMVILFPVWNILPTDNPIQESQNMIGIIVNQSVFLFFFSIPWFPFFKTVEMIISQFTKKDKHRQEICFY